MELFLNAKGKQLLFSVFRHLFYYLRANCAMQSRHFLRPFFCLFVRAKIETTTVIEIN